MALERARSLQKVWFFFERESACVCVAALMTLDQETTEKRHSQFMSLVYALIDGSIDIAQFEDQCRSLLSTNSYVLFTLDKLIRFVVKQLHALVQDDPSKHVWELYK